MRAVDVVSAYAFDPARYEPELRGILVELSECAEVQPAVLGRILRRYPKDGRRFFSKSELLRGYRYLQRSNPGDRGLDLDERLLIERLRMKPVRTQSGVAPVTVLTKPHPCPGRCIFCPSDVQMPKSYLSNEPGARRAAQHQFDPWRQTLSRLLALHQTGHDVDKVELIILGGTWSHYPESYQLWFLKRCFEALEDFGRGMREVPPLQAEVDYRDLERQVVGSDPGPTYNQVVRAFAAERARSSAEREDAERSASERATWEELAAVQQRNESAAVRCIGLVVETRPDRLDQEEVERIRRLGATKVQIGIQSLDDEVLRLNRRGHDVAATRRAMALLREAGFKIHAHWMPNLYGSSPEADIADFSRLFSDPAFRPDELKIYPCSLIESAELMAYHRDGRWQPYRYEQLLDVLAHCLAATPRYCRVTRVIRDIPGTDIVAGNRVTNFRQVVDAELIERSWQSRDIRAREIGDLEVAPEELRLRETGYQASDGREVFLEKVTAEDRLAAFLRLRLPAQASFLGELADCAIIREVHVYGRVVGLGDRSRGRAQHAGMGRELVECAATIAQRRGYRALAVISAVGTRDYYRRLGFVDSALYQIRPLAHGAV